ncbi:type II secretion system F family protein, partial [Herbaspirillum lusitanum]|uniref:type II secretion system F family protein n=1 Tax=Herbaspirillum lusitanum TaxID=213312 RepID=UPI00058C503B
MGRPRPPGQVRTRRNARRRPGAGRQAGLLDELLARLAHYKEKTLATRSKVRAALVYPVAIVAFAVLVTSIIMIWVVPSFKEVFGSFGAALPLPTLIVIAISDFLTKYWWMMAATVGGAGASLAAAIEGTRL